MNVISRACVYLCNCPTFEELFDDEVPVHACVLDMTEEGQRALGHFLVALLEASVENREGAAQYVCSLLQERLDDQRYFDPPDVLATPAQRQRDAESQDLSPVFEDLALHCIALLLSAGFSVNPRYTHEGQSANQKYAEQLRLCR